MATFDPNNPYSYSVLYGSDLSGVNDQLKSLQEALAAVNANPSAYGANADYLKQELTSNIQSQTAVQQALQAQAAEKAYVPGAQAGWSDPTSFAIDAANRAIGAKSGLYTLNNYQHSSNPTAFKAAYDAALSFWNNDIPRQAAALQQQTNEANTNALKSFRLTQPNWDAQLQALRDYYGVNSAGQATGTGKVASATAGARASVFGNAYQASQQANENLARMGLSRSGSKDVVQGGINKQASQSFGAAQQSALTDAAQNMGSYQDWVNQQKTAATNLENQVKQGGLGNFFNQGTQDAVSNYENYIGTEMGSRLQNAQQDIANKQAQDDFTSQLANTFGKAVGTALPYAFALV